MSWYQSTLFSYQSTVFNTKKWPKMAKNCRKKADIEVSAMCQENGRGDKNRTRISGFGDRCTAIVLHPYICALLLLHN